MGDLVNLRTERKRMQRRAAARAASANRLLHGSSKPARELERARAEKMKRDMEGLRIETDEKR